MKQRFILYRRKRGGMFYVEDTETRKQESLGTRNRPEALALLNARNESVRQPQLNLHIARTYLAASDPGAIERPWRVPLEEIGKTKKGATRDRWLRVLKDDAFDLIRELPLLETRPEHLLKVMEVGTVSTNVFLRRVHNFALDMGWLPWPVIPKKHWPKITFREKRAITPEEHQAILAHEPNSDRKAFYQLCWLLGASQSDVAFLGAENVDWPARVISFARKKTRTVSMIHFSDEVEAVLKMLPSVGPFFPKLRKLNTGHRATEFTRVCRRAGVDDRPFEEPLLLMPMESTSATPRETSTAMDKDGLARMNAARKRFDPTQLFAQRDRLPWFWFFVAVAVTVLAAFDRHQLVKQFKHRERVIIVDPSQTYYISPLLQFQEAKDLHAQQAELAAMAFLSRNPKEFDHVDLLKQVFLKGALAKAQDQQSREAVEFRSKQLHQKPEIARIDILATRENEVLATVSGQVIRTGVFQEKAFTEAFNFKLSLRLIRNPNMASNGRFPTAVGDFKYEVAK